MFQKDKRPSLCFSNEEFMLRCLEDKYFLNFLIEIEKQYKYVIKVPSIEDRFQTVTAIFEPFIFKPAHKNVT